MRLFKAVFLNILRIWTLLMFSTLPVHAAEDEKLWWEQAENQAVQDGYSLITTEGLYELYVKGLDMAVIDTRFAYEFERSTLPGARSLPFDLSDRFGLSPEKRQALLDATGPDKDLTIIFFCRDFR